MTVQTSKLKTYASMNAKPTAVVVYCSDPRFQKAYAEFISDELGLKDGEFIPLAILGGIASLSEPGRRPMEFQFMKDRMEFLRERFDAIERMVLISHEDCKHYESLRDAIGDHFLIDGATMPERQQHDLRGVSRKLVELFKRDLTMDLFYARFADPGHKQIVFDRIA